MADSKKNILSDSDLDNVAGGAATVFNGGAKQPAPTPVPTQGPSGPASGPAPKTSPKPFSPK
jgi:hypothetical protein